jgi:hypothetical protein
MNRRKGDQEIRTARHDARFAAALCAALRTKQREK